MKGLIVVLAAVMFICSMVVSIEAKAGEFGKVLAPTGGADSPAPLAPSGRQLGYDDGTPEEFWWFCNAEGFHDHATLFHVDEDSTIVAARLGIEHGALSGETLTIRFYSVGCGLPNAQIGPDVILNLSNEATGGLRWYTVGVPGIVVPAGDFFMVVHDPYCGAVNYATDTDNDSLPSAWSLFSWDGINWLILRDETLGADNYYMRVVLASGIPTLSQWGVIIFLVLLAGSAVWIMRRRERTA